MARNEIEDVSIILFNALNNISKSEILVPNDKLIKVANDVINRIKKLLPNYENLKLQYLKLMVEELNKYRSKYGIKYTDKEYHKMTGLFRCLWCSSDFMKDIKYCDGLCKHDYFNVLLPFKKIFEKEDETKND